MVDRLTVQERRCIALVAAGESNKDIARNLGITTDTVNSHLVRAYLRLGIGDAGNSRVAAAVMFTLHERATRGGQG
jgi:DNA-binding CsgD family transcriptional regulator